MQDEGTRQVLNAFVGMTNIIDSKKIDEVMVKTFNDILNILSDYCGPYSKYAMLTDPDNPTAQPTFTKDGLNIIRAIEFISPMEKHVKDTMAYISQRVERASGDGTTSSVIMVAAIMLSLKRIIADNDITYREFVDAYSIFASNMDEILDDKCIHAETESELYNVALAQAMTSSHGNKQLSKCVAEFYSTIPKQAWEYVTFERERKETSEEISVKVDDSDYSCDARIFDNKFYNTTHGDGFEIEGATLIINIGQMISNSLEFVTTINKLKDAIANGEKLVIISPDGADPSVRTTIDEIIGRKGNKNIGIFNLEVFNPTINDHVGLMTTLGVENIKEDEVATFTDVTVKYEEGKLYVSNVVEQTEDSLHPDYHNKDSRLYKYLMSIEDFVDKCKNAVTSREQDTLVKSARRIYNAILLQRQGHIMIGGAAYDNQALVDVVQDTLKATRATLINGATLGLYRTTSESLREFGKSHVVEHADNKDLLIKIIEAYKHGVSALADCFIKHVPDSKRALIHDAFKDDDIYNVAIECRRSLLDCLDDDRAEAVVLQPVTVDKELIKRFGEVALKFMFTNRVIIPGGVVVDKQEGE